jgi:hypothetical protein
MLLHRRAITTILSQSWFSSILALMWMLKPLMEWLRYTWVSVWIYDWLEGWLNDWCLLVHAWLIYIMTHNNAIRCDVMRCDVMWWRVYLCLRRSLRSRSHSGGRALGGQECQDGVHSQVRTMEALLLMSAVVSSACCWWWCCTPPHLAWADICSSILIDKSSLLSFCLVISTISYCTCYSYSFASHFLCAEIFRVKLFWSKRKSSPRMAFCTWKETVLGSRTTTLCFRIGQARHRARRGAIVVVFFMNFSPSRWNMQHCKWLLTHRQVPDNAICDEMTSVRVCVCVIISYIL